MHPRAAALIAYCDSETPAASLSIARHLSKCEICRGEVQRIQSEKDQLSMSERSGVPSDIQPGLDALLETIAAWQVDCGSPLAEELKDGLRSAIETYLGSRSAPFVERAGMRAEELLGRTSEILAVFLGPSAAEAVRDEVLCGLNT